MVGIAAIQPARATTLTTYTDQTAFDAVTSGVTQDFGFLSNTVGAGGAADSNVLNSATNDAYVSPGDILAGLSISVNATEIAFIGPDYGGSGSANFALFLNNSSSANGLVFTLDPGVTAFSLGVLSFPSPEDATVSVYDPESAFLGSFIVSNAPSSGAGEFFGLTTDGTDTIGSVILSPSQGTFTGVDQVQFGQTSGTPEPGSLLMLALGLAGLGGMFRLKSRNPTAVYSQV